MQDGPRRSLEGEGDASQLTDGDDSDDDDDGIHVLLDELAASMRTPAAGQGLRQYQQPTGESKKQKRQLTREGSMAQQVHDRVRRSSTASAESANQARRSSDKGKPEPFSQPPRGSIDSDDSWNMPQVQTSGMDTLLHRKPSQRAMPRMDDLIQFMAAAADTPKPAPATSSRSPPKQRRRKSAQTNRQADALGPMRQMRPQDLMDFQARNRNGDTHLNHAELDANCMRRMDANGDSKVSMMEFMKQRVSDMQDRNQQPRRSLSPPSVRAPEFVSSMSYSPESDEALSAMGPGYQPLQTQDFTTANSGSNAWPLVQAPASGHTGFFPKFTGINPAYVQEQQRRQMQNRRLSHSDIDQARADPFITFSAAAKSRYLDPVSTQYSPNIEAQTPFAAHLNIPDPFAPAASPSLPTRATPLADVAAELASPFWRTLPPGDAQQSALPRRGSSSSVHFFPLGSG